MPSTPCLNLIVVLLAAMYVGIEAGSGAAAIVSVDGLKPAPVEQRTAQIPTLPGMRDFSASLEPARTAPLFNQGRRPPPPPEPPPPPPPPPIADDVSDVKVVAIFMGGSTTTALVTIATGETIRLKPGAVFRRWNVVSVSKAGVSLSAGGETKEIPFERTRSVDPRKAAGLNASN